MRLDASMIKEGWANGKVIFSSWPFLPGGATSKKLIITDKLL
jgi:hypothetical protein